MPTTALRDLSEKKIRHMLLNSSTYRWEANNSPDAKPESLKLVLFDPDESLPANRRRVDLVTIFRPGDLPVIISGWRDGSPQLAGGQDCRLNPTTPPCQQRNRKPRGRIL